MPPGAQGMLWRIVLDERIPDGLADIRAAWTLDDVVHATDFLDQLDTLAARDAAERARMRQ